MGGPMDITMRLDPDGIERLAAVSRQMADAAERIEAALAPATGGRVDTAKTEVYPTGCEIVAAEHRRLIAIASAARNLAEAVQHQRSRSSAYTAGDKRVYEDEMIAVLGAKP